MKYKVLIEVEVETEDYEGVQNSAYNAIKLVLEMLRNNADFPPENPVTISCCGHSLTELV